MRGDVYEADGTVTRNAIDIDLGDLSWAAYSGSSGNYFFTQVSPRLKGATNNDTPSKNIICAEYPVSYFNSSGVYPAIKQDMNGSLLIIDQRYFNYTAAQMKQAIKGVHVIGLLATPTTETAEPYASHQVVNDWGTEEYVSGNVVPVGHDTKYPANLRDKLQHLPSLVSEDGLYGIQQTGSDMSLVSILNKANVDGNYPNMTVGNAEQLVSTVGIDDSVPYNFRTSGGNVDIGDREVDEIIGGTIAWNQLVQNGNFASASGWGITFSDTSISVANNILTATVTNTVTRWSGVQTSSSLGVVTGHKFIACALMQGSHDGFEFGIQNVNYIRVNKTTVGAWTEVSWVGTSVENTLHKLQFYYGTNYSQYQTGDTIKIKSATVFDITQMFGTAIADYIYNLEQSTAGAGVAWFKKLFPKSYYEYNAGELMSVNVSEHNMVGFNQWDGVTEFPGKYFDYQTGVISSNGSWSISSKIPALPDTTYYIKNNNSGNVIVGFWDENDNYLGFRLYSSGNQTFISRATNINCYMRFEWQGSLTEGCINLSWDGERNGEYEPYVKYSYPLDSSLTLRGIPKLTNDNKLYYDGDTYASDGTVTRRYGIVDLGTMSWGLSGSGDSAFFYSTTTIGVKASTHDVVCSKYSYGDVSTGGTANKVFSITNNPYVRIRDTDYSDATSFKAAMSGVMLVYKLAEPTTETAEAYQNPQIVSDWGTEAYVDYAESQGTRDVAVPVGHNTVYQPNLRAKLEMAPDSPDSNGDYIVRHANGENSYVPLVIPQELPTAPSANGTYTLKATVSNGTVTYSWT